MKNTQLNGHDEKEQAKKNSGTKKLGDKIRPANSDHHRKQNVKQPKKLFSDRDEQKTPE